MTATATAILQSAKRLFAQGGAETLGVRAVAAAVGVTPMAIYRHYPGKNGLLDAVAADAFAAWERRIAAVRGSTPMAWIENAALAYLDFALRSPRRFEAAFLLRTNVARRFPADFANARSPAGTVLLERIEEAVAAGTLSGARPLDIAIALWASAHGLIMLHRARRFMLDEKAFRTLYADTIRRTLAGFAPTVGGKRRP